MIFRLVSSVGKRRKLCVPVNNRTSDLWIQNLPSPSLYLQNDAIDIADPSSMQEACRMNFVIKPRSVVGHRSANPEV